MKVTIVAALTVDGLIAKNAVHAANWTSSADKRFFRQTTTDLGTVVVGATTYRTINRALPQRRMIVLTTRGLDNPTPEIETFSGSPAALIAKLESEGVTQLGVIGGTNVYTQFMANGLVDELILTIEPQVFGQGMSLFDNALEQTLELLSIERLGDNSIVLRYKVEH